MKTLVRSIAIAYGIYIALALLVVTPALNFLPKRYIADNYGREFDTQWVWFNPFTLSLEVREAALKQPNGEGFVALDAASINLSTSSLWRPGIVFDALRVEQLDLALTRETADRYNFSDLLAAPGQADAPAPSEAPSTTPDEAGGALGITIHTLALSAKRIAVSDLARTPNFAHEWRDLALNASDLSTVLEPDEPLRIAITDEAGGRLELESTLSIAAARSAGQLQLADLSLLPAWRFAQPWVNFELGNGALDGQIRYSANWKETATFTLDGSTLSLKNLAIAPKDAAMLPDTGLALSRLDVSGIDINSTDESVRIASLAVDGLNVAGFMEGDTLSLTQLFAMNLPASDDTDDSEPSNWRITLDKASVSESEVHWRSPFTEPAQFDLTDIAITASPLQWPLAGETQLTLATLANAQGQLNAEGTLALGAGDGSLRVDLQNMALPWFDPAIPEALQAQVANGQLTTQADITLSAFAPAQIALNAKVDSFALNANVDEQMVTGFSSLNLEQLAIDMDKRDLQLAKLTLDGLQGRVHIAEDGTVNASQLWQTSEAAPEQEVTEEKDTEPAKNASEDAPEDTETATSDVDAPWAMTIPMVAINNATIDFEDKSLPIEFRTVVGKLGGTIKGLSSDPSAQAAVDIKGSVDGYAPVTLAGTINPLLPQPALDLDLQFKGVDLSRVTPYSGTYAGYAIERGLLDLDLKYALAENRLRGDNDIVINQLKLGDTVESDKAVSLPLKLAVSLLTDANGVIDMQIPVKGNIDDPKFQIGSVIFGAFVNLITKAVTAPFSLLAGLVGGGEDMQMVPFAPGSSTLEQAGIDNLNKLAEALKQRPGLAPRIVGRIDQGSDSSALQTQALHQALLEAGLDQSSIDTRDAAYRSAIGKRFAKLPDTVQAAALPKAEASTGDMPPSASETSAAVASETLLAAQETAVLSSFPVDEPQLLRLAEARATAVKAYLTNTAGLEPSRAVIAQAKPGKQKTAFAGAEMVLGD